MFAEGWYIRHLFTTSPYIYIYIYIHTRYIATRNLDPLQVNDATVTPTQNVRSSSTVSWLTVGTRKYGVGVYSIITCYKVEILQ